MQNRKEIQKQAISLFFHHRFKNGQEALLKKDLICKRLEISLNELDHILDNYYAEPDKANVFSLMWTQAYPNSYTLPQKTSFIDFIVKKEHVKLQKSQLKENKDQFEGGIAVWIL